MVVARKTSNMAVSIRGRKAGSLDRKVERIGTDGLGTAWRVEAGERLVDLEKKEVFLPENRSKMAKKRAKIGLF
jgi:hypothetical protein